MDVGIRKLKQAVLAGTLLCFAMTAPAEAERCWEQAAVESAQVKEFDIMLMVATLRCQRRGIDFSDRYNNFVRLHRTELKAAGEDLMRQFTQNLGNRGALQAYDKLGVEMANKYGSGFESLGCEDFLYIINQAEALPVGRAGLVDLAKRAGMAPSLPGQRCVPAPPSMTAAAP